MKKFIFYLFVFFILTDFPVQATENQDMWTVFEPKTLQEHTVTISDISDLDHSEMDISLPNDLSASSTIGGDVKEITGNASLHNRAAVVIKTLEYINSKGEKKYNYCSGAIIGPRTVLTSAHCLTYNGRYILYATVYATGMPINKQKVDAYHGENEPPNTSERYYSPNKKFEDLPYLDFSNTLIKDIEKQIKQQVENESKQHTLSSYPNANSKQFWTPKHYRRINNKEEYYTLTSDDYGIIVLDKDLGYETGWLGLRAVPDGTIPQWSQIILLEHMFYKHGLDYVVLITPQNECSLFQSPGLIFSRDEDYIYYYATTMGSSSGAPILRARDPKYIIALHVALSDKGQKVGVRITKKIIKAVKKIEKNI